MADEISLYGEPSFDAEQKTQKENDLGKKNLQKFGASLTDLGKDSLQSLKDTGSGFIDSIKDITKSKSDRRDTTDDIDFIIEDVSIANRHKDAINDVLTNTFNGNLFDAGVTALNLYNFGTKWRLVRDQFTDKDTYAFRYLYYYGYGSNKSNKNSTEIERIEKIKFFETIEDPTILGFSLRIDYDDSPLFKMDVSDTNKNNDKTETEALHTVNPKNIPIDKNATETEPNTQGKFNKKAVGNGENSAFYFINRYKGQYRELIACEQYLREFIDSAKMIFEAPETLDDSGYKNPFHKNHYIYEIKGLDKLDNHFVEYKDKDAHEALELTLGEDVRMYVNRMRILYKNLTWSYNMGKKLIPENKLRFTMYIKVSDIRQFTSGDDRYKNIIEDRYSRVIYELKDCEFLFEENIVPNILKVGGSPNEQYATLNLKIKYRKVNRIFYSNMFSRKDMFIGDKFYEPLKYSELYGNELKAWRYYPTYTKQRTDKTNNIPVQPSISERIDVLKNKGIFSTDDNDTALNRFAKGIGNKAVNAGANIVDEGLQTVKSKLNGVNPITGSIRDFLNETVKLKTVTYLHEDVDSTINKPKKENVVKSALDKIEDVLTGKNNTKGIKPPKDNIFKSAVKTIENALSDKTKKGIEPPKETLDNGIINKTKPINEVLDNGIIEKLLPPYEDVHQELEVEITNPNEILHDGSGTITKPNEILHDGSGTITNPNEILHDGGNTIINPNEILHEGSGTITNPNEVLHGESNNAIIVPKEALHNNIDSNIVNPNENINNSLDSQIESPNEILHGTTNKNIEPNEKLHKEVYKENTTPNEILHDKVDGTITIENVNLNNGNNNDVQKPKENLHEVFKKYIRKDPTQKDDC